jgi:hypothetical protein
MADPKQPGAETDPASAEGKTGLQGGYGSDTGFAADQAQRPSGQVQDSADGGDVLTDGDGGGDGDPDDPRSIGAVSATDQRAGSSTGGSASGGEPRSNPDDRLRDERHEAAPAGVASKVAADVTEDLGVLGDDEDTGGRGRSADAGGRSGQVGGGETRSFAQSGQGSGGAGSSGLQSGGHMTQPGTMNKRTATDFSEDEGHFDRGEAHMGNDRDPPPSGRGPQANHQKSAF